MCLIAFAWQAHPGLALVVAANRDEYHARPTRAAHWWQAPAGLFAGADLRAGGAWCGMDRRGRFAAVTNVRDSVPAATTARSRGLLVRDYFAGARPAAAWAARAAAEGDAFGPFNLLVADTQSLWFVSNRGRVRHKRISPGVHAMANGHWGDRWPKTEAAQARLARLLQAGETGSEQLFELLADSEPAATARLPDTGIATARERLLSPLFVRSPAYGTRASTVIRLDAAGRVDFHEQGFNAAARPAHRVDQRWALTAPEVV